MSMRRQLSLKGRQINFIQEIILQQIERLNKKLQE